jgi:hypothetical protein
MLHEEKKEGPFLPLRHGRIRKIRHRVFETILKASATSAPPLSMSSAGCH